VSAVLLEQDDYWQLEDRSMFSAACMAAIAILKDLPAPWASSHNSILQKNTVKETLIKPSLSGDICLVLANETTMCRF
jgi:hypothetical protein